MASFPLVMVVEPLTPDCDAVHVLSTPSAISGPGPTPPTHGSGLLVPGAVHVPLVGARVIWAELVTEPSAPVVPWVLTVIGPDGGPIAAAFGH
jgi:hypothetical protein